MLSGLAQVNTDVAPLLQSIVDATVDTLGDNLTGIYLHGSLAFGCFTWENSDVDYIVVVNAPLSSAQRLNLMARTTALVPDAPPKGLEMSVVLAAHCRGFLYPTPYELHFSNMYLARYRQNPEEYCVTMTGDDHDLAAHFTVIKARGKLLYGPPIDSVFGDVPPAFYLDSILRDITESAENFASCPVSTILNLCRVMAFCRGSGILSKEEGGRWALESLPDFSPMVSDALAAYLKGSQMTISPQQQRHFCIQMLADILKLTSDF